MRRISRAAAGHAHGRCADRRDDTRRVLVRTQPVSDFVVEGLPELLALFQQADRE